MKVFGAQDFQVNYVRGKYVFQYKGNDIKVTKEYTGRTSRILGSGQVDHPCYMQVGEKTWMNIVRVSLRQLELRFCIMGEMQGVVVLRDAGMERFVAWFCDKFPPTPAPTPFQTIQRPRTASRQAARALLNSRLEAAYKERRAREQSDTHTG